MFLTRFYSFFVLMALGLPMVVLANSDGIHQTGNYAGAVQMLYEKERNVWWLSENAAGLTLLPLPQIGVAGVTLDYTDGDFKRPQQAQTMQHLKFHTEKFTALENINVWGRFSYAQNQDRDLQWTDVLFPYNGNPFVFADDRGGDWKKQFFDLEARAASVQTMGFLRYGAILRYRVGSGARQNDPRPLNRLKELTFKPSVIATLNATNSLGLVLSYSEFREDLSIRIRNRDDNFRFYKLMGLGEYHSGFMSSYSRFYEGNIYGTSLQWENQAMGASLFATAGIDYREEVVVDGGTSGQSGGDYESLNVYGGLSSKWVSNGLSHQVFLNASWNYSEGFEQVQAYNPEEFIWETVFSTRRTGESVYIGSLRYSLSNPGKHAGNYVWQTLVEAGFRDRIFEYFGPSSSMMVKNMDFSIHHRRNVRLPNAGQLHWGLVFHASFSPDGDLDLSQYLYEVERAVVADQVTVPDFLYLTTDFLGGSLSLQYDFPLNFGRGLSMYAKASASHFTPLGDDYSGARSSFQVGVGFNY